MVMYLGKVVEIGDTEAIYANPAHPYTRALLASMPSMDPDRRTLTPPLAGDPPNPIDPPPGCSFHPRCGLAEAVCARRAPVLSATIAGHQVSCLMAEPDSGHSRATARRAEAAVADAC